MILALFSAPARALRRATLWWALGIAALVVVTVAVWPAFRGASGISSAIEQLPSGVIQAFGLQGLDTPAGFLRGNLYELIVPILLAAAAVALVSGQTAGEESAGRLELFLAEPVDRGALYLARAVAALVAVAVITAVALAAQLATGAVVAMEIDLGLVLATVALCGLLAVLHGAFAYLLAAVTGRPGLVLGLGIGLAVAGYVVSALFPISNVLAPWRHVSPWDWAFGGNPLEHATELWRYAALALPAVVFLGLGTLLVRKRDIAAP
jgi:ABC-2 type transport system permease protein